jgi:hypothetical protein
MSWPCAQPALVRERELTQVKGRRGRVVVDLAADVSHHAGIDGRRRGEEGDEPLDTRGRRVPHRVVLGEEVVDRGP